MKFLKDAYAPGALVDAGIHPEVVRTLLADDPAGRLERPRLAMTGRKRGPATSVYVWGPDAAVLLSEGQQRRPGGAQWT